MAIKTTTWSPDTCGCVLQYTWDPDVPQDARVHSPATVLTKCSAHAAHPIAAHYAAVLDENSRKNKHLALIMDNFPALTTTDATGNTILKDGLVSWSFDASRVLQISVKGLSTLQKTTLQTLTNTALGSGKIAIQ